jgi:hypothetical protein
MRAQKVGDHGLSGPAFSDRSHEILEHRFVRIDREVVDTKKDNTGGDTCPLVSVHERVVLHDVEEVGRCHLEDVVVEILSAERGRGLCDRGLQEALIPDSR